MYCFYVAAVALLLVAHHSFVSVAFIVRFVSFEAVRHLLLDTTHRYDRAVGIIHTNVKRDNKYRDSVFNVLKTRFV